jgi:hypothetical protein
MKVQRRSWPADVYGIVQDGYLMIKKEDGMHQWIISDGDLFGEDWRII